MFKDLQVGNVFSYQCLQCEQEHGVLVLEIEPPGYCRLARIKGGVIASILRPSLMWRSDVQEFQNAVGSIKLKMKLLSIKLEPEKFSPAEVASRLTDFYEKHS